jgi:hypothetical protein
LCGFFGNSNQQQVLFQSALKTDADAAQFWFKSHIGKRGTSEI